MSDIKSGTGPLGVIYLAVAFDGTGQPCMAQLGKVLTLDSLRNREKYKLCSGVDSSSE